MTWAGESGPAGSGLYVFADDGSPKELVGNPGQLLAWVNPGIPKFVNQNLVTDTPAPLTSGVFATSLITTTSNVDSLVPGMTITPPSGTYLCFFRGQGNPDPNTALQSMSIYAAGTQIDGSEVTIQRGGGATQDMLIPFTCIGIATVNGSQAIEGYWSAGTLETALMDGERALFIIEARNI